MLCFIVQNAVGQSVTRITTSGELIASSTAAMDHPLHRDVHQIFNTSSGLPQDTVRQFLQARNGYLWIATEGGLVRFDGYDFVTFDKRNTPAIGSDLINAVFEERVERSGAAHLWISTSNGITEISGSSFSHYSTRNGLPSDNVWAIAQDAAGHIWAATTSGLARLEAGTFKPFPASGTFTGRLALPFVLAKDGTLWGVSNNAVTRIDTAGNAHVLPLNSAAADIAVDGQSSLWLATASSLVHIDSQGRASTLPLPAEPGTRLQAVTVDQRGMLWLGTNTGLYSRSIGGSSSLAWTHSSKQQGLPAVGVNRLFTDPAGALWVATEAGVFRYSHERDCGELPTAERFMPMFEQDGFKGSDLLTLYRDAEGDMWFGSDSAGAAILRHPAFTTFTRHEGLPSDIVRSVFAFPSQSGRDDRLWFGTGAGLSSFVAGTFHNVGSAQGIASDEILALAAGPVAAGMPQPLWIGTPDGLSYLQGTKSLTLTASDGLPDDSIRSLLLARSGALWIGTGHGLACLPHADVAEAHAIRTVTQSGGLASNVIGSLLEDPDGSLWIGTLSGLSHLVMQGSKSQQACDLSTAHTQTFAAREGLTSPVVTALSTSRQGLLWIGTNGGGIFAHEQGRIVRVGSEADYASGRLPATIYSIVEDATGFIWLGSSTGIDRVRSSDLAAIAHGNSNADSIAMAHFDVADGLRIHDLASNGHPEAALTSSGNLWFATLKGASVVDTHDPSLTLPAPPVALEGVTIDDIPAPAPHGEPLSIAAGAGRVAFHYAGLSMAQPAKVRYRYQLDHFDRSWIDAGARRTAYYTNIPPGHYTFRVAASFNGGAWSVATAELPLTIAPHYYQTWWFYTLLILLLAAIAWQLYLYRLRQVELRFHAVLAERGRIAREIHDTLAQDIVGISVQLELVSRLLAKSVDQAVVQLQETRALVRKSLADARSSIWDLRSPTSGAGDLPSRLRTLAKRLVMEAKTEPRIDLDIHITGTYRPFPELQESELLRIAQEAITNATRHAKPKTIRIALIYHAAGVQLELQDDGKGFEVPAQKSGPPGHYGIRGMYERADRAHARLSIRSTPGSGTTVTADVAQQ